MNFLQRHFRPLEPDDVPASGSSPAATGCWKFCDVSRRRVSWHHDTLWTIDDLAAAVRRWIGTKHFRFRVRTAVFIIDDQAARFGDFDDMTIVGLVETEWPERPRRRYLLSARPAEITRVGIGKDRRAADEHVSRLARIRVTELALFTFTLDDEALVSRSILLDEVPRARLCERIRLKAGHHDAGLHASGSSRTPVSEARCAPRR
jgi:hypothetical protein